MWKEFELYPLLSLKKKPFCLYNHEQFFFLRCVDAVKRSKYSDLANDLEIDKAIMYLKKKDFRQVRRQIFLISVHHENCKKKTNTIVT